MNNLEKKYEFFWLGRCAIFLISVLSFYFGFVEFEPTDNAILMLQLLIVVNLFILAWFFFHVYGVKKIINPVFLIFFLLFIFHYSRIVFDLFGLYDAKVPNLLGQSLISSEVFYKSLMVYSVFLSAFSFAVLISVKSKNINQNYISFKYNGFIFNFGLVLMAVGFFPAVYIQFSLYLKISQIGYLNLFLYGLNVDLNPVVVLLSSFLRLGLILVLISYPSRRAVLIALLLYSPIIVLGILTGVRGYYMAQLLIIGWYLLYVRNFWVLSWSKFLFFVTLFVFISQVIASLRDGVISSFSFDSFFSFFYDQGTTFLTVVYAVEHKVQLSDLSFINFFDVFFSPHLLIQDRVDWLVNPFSKSLGHSLGGSIIQEFYLILGLVGVFLFGFIWFFSVLFVVEVSKKNRFGIGFLIVVLPNILFSVRARTFDFLYQNYLFLVMFFLFFLFFLLVSSFSVSLQTKCRNATSSVREK